MSFKIKKEKREVSVILGMEGLKIPAGKIVKVAGHTTPNNTDIGDILVATGNSKRPFMILKTNDPDRSNMIGELWHDHIYI